MHLLTQREWLKPSLVDIAERMAQTLEIGLARKDQES